MKDPILYFGEFLNKLSKVIDDNGLYLFMVFTWACIASIVWLLFRKRKTPSPTPASARTRAIVGIMLASPDMSSDADGGRTRLIMGDISNKRANDLGSNSP
ncbi:MAG TPA: hypothetical protein VG938_00385 [Verrucomicrobiae bacterium]|jgi:hypothetical protein|nr:hypothetical protein [Verrucomicrobiae bacterium]